MPSITVPIHLRWSDMDMYEHVNNVVYANYLESARVEFLANYGLEPTVDGYGQFVSRLEIDYLAPLSYRSEPVLMELWVSEIGASSYVINYRLHVERKTFITARTVMVCVSVEHGIPGRIPAQLCQILESASAT